MENYEKKYLKYKKKYLNLVNQLGGTKEENNNFLLHGTNLFYIDDIIKNGLTGLYNQQIYNIIEKYWPKIRHLALDGYVNDFIYRQNLMYVNHTPSLSFTGQLSVAKEYSEGVRKFGEGPSRFLRTMKEYIINSKKEELSEDLCEAYKFLLKAYQNPGLILAIDKNDFEQTKDLSIENLDKWEHTLSFSIPNDKLYIRRGNKDYIKLLSEEGQKYINTLKDDTEVPPKIKEGNDKITEAEITYLYSIVDKEVIMTSEQIGKYFIKPDFYSVLPKLKSFKFNYVYDSAKMNFKVKITRVPEEP